MGRIRTVKPEYFKHLKLFELEESTGLPLRVAYAALWTVADREGRFTWIPRQLKIDCLPYDDVDFSRVLDALMTRDFVRKYTINDDVFGYIPAFSDHQVINNRESASKLPNPRDCNELTRATHVNDATTTPTKGKGREGKGKEQDKNNTPDGGLNGYIFEGENFRINQKDFLKHQSIYPNLNLLTEYQQLDIELRDTTKKQRWGALNAKLNYRNKNGQPSNRHFGEKQVSNVEQATLENAAYAAQLEEQIRREALASDD